MSLNARGSDTGILRLSVFQRVMRDIDFGKSWCNKEDSFSGSLLKPQASSLKPQASIIFLLLVCATLNMPAGKIHNKTAGCQKTGAGEVYDEYDTYPAGIEGMPQSQCL